MIRSENLRLWSWSDSPLERVVMVTLLTYLGQSALCLASPVISTAGWILSVLEFGAKEGHFEVWPGDEMWITSSFLWRGIWGKVRTLGTFWGHFGVWSGQQLSTEGRGWDSWAYAQAVNSWEAPLWTSVRVAKSVLSKSFWNVQWSHHTEDKITLSWKGN